MSEKTGRNLKFLRENNINEVLRYLTLHGEASRIELSREMGLSKMTITNLVSELMEAGYIYETPARQQAMTAGPKPKLLAIRPRKIIALGVYISRDRLYGILTDIKGRELYIKEKALEKEGLRERLLEEVEELIRQVLEWGSRLKKRIVGIGLSMVGLVDSENGAFVRSTDMLGDRLYPAREYLSERFPYPVWVRNDSQATALAEQIYGLGADCSNFIYFGITHGVGTAVVNDGRILSGSRGFAVEAGHMSVNYEGPLCSCGNRGCVEAYISIPVLLRETESESVEEMMEKYREKDGKTRQVMERFVLVASRAITNLANIFDTEKIVIGYEGTLFHKDILNAVENQVNQSCIWRQERQIEIVASPLGSVGPIRGAASIVFEKLYEGQIKLPGL